MRQIEIIKFVKAPVEKVSNLFNLVHLKSSGI